MALLSLLVVSLVCIGSAADGGLRGAAPLNFTLALAGASSDQTDITGKLNGLLDNPDRGVVLRTPDFVDGVAKPATLWRSDIYPPNQFYMVGANFEVQSSKPQVGFVIDDDAWDNIILDTYYPHDANACDASPDGNPVYGRCIWEDSQWNCPAAYVSTDGDVTFDSNAVGASANKCRGCHFDEKNKGDGDWYMNQDLDVVGNYDCNCPGPDVIDWSDRDSVCEWVQTNLVDSGRLFNAIWSGDPVACWVDNPVALSHLQNCYYWKYYGDNFDKAAAEWWGWNEIGASAAVDDPANWQTIMIFLPSQLRGQGLGDLSSELQQELQDTIMNDYVTPGHIQIGGGSISDRPGSSYVVMANEYPDETSSMNWLHHFFCQSWIPAVTTPEFQVCFKAQDDDPNGYGYCYFEYPDQPCL